MKRESRSLLIAVAVVFALGVISGAGCTARFQRRHTASVFDTVYVNRTVEIPVPTAPAEVHKSNSCARIPKDRVSDAGDTSAVLVRKDSVIYHGIEKVSGISYTASITGVEPKLEMLKIMVPERHITKTVVKPLDGWAFGMFGDGAYNGSLGASAGVYASYTAGVFHFHLDAGAMWQGIGQDVSVSPYVGVGVRVDVFRKR